MALRLDDWCQEWRLECECGCSSFEWRWVEYHRGGAEAWFQCAECGKPGDPLRTGRKTELVSTYNWKDREKEREEKVVADGRK